MTSFFENFKKSFKYFLEFFEINSGLMTSFFEFKKKKSFKYFLDFFFKLIPVVRFGLMATWRGSERRYNRFVAVVQVVTAAVMAAPKTNISGARIDHVTIGL